MKKPSELTDKDIIKQKESDPYLTLVNGRVKNLSRESEEAEFLLCKKSFVRLLKLKLSNENEFIECFEKYTYRLNTVIYILKNDLEYSQKRIQNKDEEITNLTARLDYLDSFKDQSIALKESIIELMEKNIEQNDLKIESLSEEITLLKANPDRRKSGTTVYFGKLCIVN